MMCDYIECVFIKINYLDYKLIVGVVYRPPNSNMVDFNGAGLGAARENWWLELITGMEWCWGEGQTARM